jgi:hypothetical protein
MFAVGARASSCATHKNGDKPASIRLIGTTGPPTDCELTVHIPRVRIMHEIIYIIGLIVVVMFILGALGLR